MARVQQQHCVAGPRWRHASRLLLPPNTHTQPTHMVRGCMSVSLGVASRGLVGPKTAMVEGANTRSPCWAARSNTLWMPACGMQSGMRGMCTWSGAPTTRQATNRPF